MVLGDLGVINRLDENNNIENFSTFSGDEFGTVGNDENRSLPDNTDPSADLEGFLKTGMVGIGDTRHFSRWKNIRTVVNRL